MSTEPWSRGPYRLSYISLGRTQHRAAAEYCAQHQLWYEMQTTHRIGRSHTDVSVFGDAAHLEAFADWHNSRVSFAKSGLRLGREDLQRVELRNAAELA